MKKQAISPLILSLAIGVIASVLPLERLASVKYSFHRSEWPRDDPKKEMVKAPSRFLLATGLHGEDRHPQQKRGIRISSEENYAAKESIVPVFVPNNDGDETTNEEKTTKTRHLNPLQESEARKPPTPSPFAPLAFWMTPNLPVSTTFAEAETGIWTDGISLPSLSYFSVVTPPTPSPVDGISSLSYSSSSTDALGMKPGLGKDDDSKKVTKKKKKKKCKFGKGTKAGKAYHGDNDDDDDSQPGSGLALVEKNRKNAEKVCMKHYNYGSKTAKAYVDDDEDGKARKVAKCYTYGDCFQTWYEASVKNVMHYVIAGISFDLKWESSMINNLFNSMISGSLTVDCFHAWFLLEMIFMCMFVLVVVSIVSMVCNRQENMNDTQQISAPYYYQQRKYKTPPKTYAHYDRDVACRDSYSDQTISPFKHSRQQHYAGAFQPVDAHQNSVSYRNQTNDRNRYTERLNTHHRCRRQEVELCFNVCLKANRYDFVKRNPTIEGEVEYLGDYYYGVNKKKAQPAMTSTKSNIDPQSNDWHLNVCKRAPLDATKTVQNPFDQGRLDPSTFTLPSIAGKNPCAWKFRFLP